MEFEKLNESLVPKLVEFWNRNMGIAYNVSEKMVCNKIVHDVDLFGAGTFICLDEGEIKAFIATKISDNSLPEYQNTAWISALIVDSAIRHIGWGTELYEKCEKLLKAAGIKKIIVAGEMNNFFSGIPDPKKASMEFFKNLGFVLNSEEHFDLANDVSKVDFDSISVSSCDDNSYETRPVKKEDYKSLEAFLNKEFPGRWKQEVMEYLSNGGDPKYVLVLMNDRAVKGFCRISVNSRANDYDMYFGQNWGSLGPIGIAKNIRGCGLGNRILCDSLRYLKKIGANNVNIDWTVLRKYYGQFGFEPWRTYLGAYKLL